MLNMLIIQVIGAVAYGAIAFSYFKKEKREILFIQIIAYIFFTIHYYLLNGVTGAICNFMGLLALITIYVFEKYKLKNKLLVSMFFIVLIFIINILTFQNIFSIFPMIASIIVIISFLKDSENLIRGIGIVSAVCWLIYAIVYKSYISIIFEVVTLIDVCVAFMKNFYNKKKNT